MRLSLIKTGIIILSITLPLSSLMLSSCKKGTCSGTEVDTAYLDPKVKSSVAYKGYDTLFFLNESLDSVTLKGGDTTRYFNSVSNSTSCDGVSKRLEGNRIAFMNSSNVDLLYHSLYVSSADDNTRIAVYYEGINFELPYANLRYPLMKTMELNGKVYNDLYIVLSANKPDSLYYSLKHGIVRIKLTDGRLLQLF